MTTGRSLRASKRSALALLATLAAAPAPRVSAHRLDEFLHAARIAVERDRVQLEMTLTPGMIVADTVIHEIDADRNGILSQKEGQAYADRVLGALTVRLDDSPPLQMEPTGLRFPDVAALHAGNGAIIVRSEANVSRLPAGPHRLHFHNTNTEGHIVYLANALVPEHDDVAVTAQQRTGDQSQLTIEFVVRESEASRGEWAWIGLVGAFMLAVSLSRRPRLL